MILNILKNQLLPAALLAFTISTSGYATGQTISLVQPISTIKSNQIVGTSATTTPDYITRTGSVELAVSELKGLALSVKKEPDVLVENLTILLSFFYDQEVEIIVDSIEDEKGIFTLSGHLKDEISSFAITTSSEKYIITFKELKSKILYKVVGDMETGIGEVKEVDLAKRPAVIHLPPMIPNQ